MLGLRKVAQLLAALIAVALSGGCAKNFAVTADTFCGVMGSKPVCIDKQDRLTEQTATKIEGINRAAQRLCRPIKPCRIDNSKKTS